VAPDGGTTLNPGGLYLNVSVSGSDIVSVSDVAVLSFPNEQGFQPCYGSATLPIYYTGTGFNPTVTVTFGTPVARANQTCVLTSGGTTQHYINAFLDVYRVNPANNDDYGGGGG
jgi:hypothetical protein